MQSDDVDKNIHHLSLKKHNFAKKKIKNICIIMIIVLTMTVPFYIIITFVNKTVLLITSPYQVSSIFIKNIFISIGLIICVKHKRYLSN